MGNKVSNKLGQKLGKKLGKNNRKKRWSAQRWGLLCGVWLLLGLLLPWVSQAQLPPINFGTPHDRTVQVKRIGGLEVAPVFLMGQKLFEIASPVPQEESPDKENSPVIKRAAQIEANLHYLISLKDVSLRENVWQLETLYDPDTFVVRLDKLNNQLILSATDAHHPLPQIIMTVTERDAAYHNLTKEDLGARWQAYLESNLIHHLRERSPESLMHWFHYTFTIIVILLLFSGASLGLLGWLNLYGVSDLKRSSFSTTDKTKSFGILGVLSHRWSGIWASQKMQEVMLFLKGFLFWTTIIVWLIGIAFVIDRLPLVQWTVYDVLIVPLLLIVILIFAGIINRLTNGVINRSIALWFPTSPTSLNNQERRILRLTTAVNVAKGFKTFLLYFIAVIIILNLLGFNTRTILAFSAIIGFAISLASQNLIRDLVNGSLILLEDQYAIGDQIRVDNLEGVVENLNLRITQIRDPKGRLITLPNSTISRVENLTRLWARVDQEIEIATDIDIDQALQVFQEVSQAFYHDPLWSHQFVEPPKVLGIEKISHSGITIRIWIKTQPLQQANIAREFRLRLIRTLHQHQIPLGVPQQRLWESPAASPSSTDDLSS